MAPDPPLSTGEVKIINQVVTGASKVGSGWQESAAAAVAAVAEAAARGGSQRWRRGRQQHCGGITAAALQQQWPRQLCGSAALVVASAQQCYLLEELRDQHRRSRASPNSWLIRLLILMLQLAVNLFYDVKSDLKIAISRLK